MYVVAASATLDDKALHQGQDEVPLRPRITGFVQRATDKLIHRLSGVQHLRGDFAAANGKRSIEQTDLDEHRNGTTLTYGSAVIVASA
jgi:hypothetical protein